MQNLNELKCVLVQAELTWADAAANRQQLGEIARQKGPDSDLIVFPETFTSGFLGDADAEPENMQGATLKWMKALASELDCVICGSAAISVPDGTANRFLWFSPMAMYSSMINGICLLMAVKTKAMLRVQSGRFFITVVGGFVRRFVLT